MVRIETRRGKVNVIHPDKNNTYSWQNLTVVCRTYSGTTANTGDGMGVMSVSRLIRFSETIRDTTMLTFCKNEFIHLVKVFFCICSLSSWRALMRPCSNLSTSSLCVISWRVILEWAFYDTETQYKSISMHSSIRRQPQLARMCVDDTHTRGYIRCATTDD